MKFTTKEGEGEKIEKEKEIMLYLESSGNSVIVKGIDDDGDVWNIMKFENGRFYRDGSIPEDIGFEVDKSGKIEETEIRD